jgi:hypothetical protein
MHNFPQSGHSSGSLLMILFYLTTSLVAHFSICSPHVIKAKVAAGEVLFPRLSNKFEGPWHCITVDLSAIGSICEKGSCTHLCAHWLDNGAAGGWSASYWRNHFGKDRAVVQENENALSTSTKASFCSLQELFNERSSITLLSACTKRVSAIRTCAMLLQRT